MFLTHTTEQTAITEARKVANIGRMPFSVVLSLALPHEYLVIPSNMTDWYKGAIYTAYPTAR